MSTADFLLELRSEEIPARMQDKARDDLARLFADALAKAGLAAAAIETFATPRRLTLIARDLPLATQAVREETKGPRASAPPQALEGFLRKTGLARADLIERDGVLFALVEKPGRATAEVLAEAIPAIVRAFPWPKSMRWGTASTETTSLRWVRPLQGIVALLGEMVVPFVIDGIESGAATLGHRFHHPGPITIGSAADYAVKLRTAHVIVDQAERRAIVAEGAARAAAAEGLSIVPDEGLIAENAGLTEWPVPLLGRFDPAFLEVPREVIQLTMRTNQKYFACVDAEGRLAPAFVCTANIAASDGGAAIVAGNRKVLAARLSDARFFWEQDLRVPLAEQAKKLDRIVFHEKLGTVADKVERVAKLARWLVEEGIVRATTTLVMSTPATPTPFVSSEVETRAAGVSPEARPSTSLGTNGEGEARSRLADMAELAARLCKADLVTGMVGEFPELQGVMGGYYARADNLPDEVADAIRDHYKPVGQGDEVPTAPVTVAVSLADKLDTICAFFAIDQKPSGSRDPFALRRAALGVISVILQAELRIPLLPFLEFMMLIAWRDGHKGQEIARSIDNIFAWRMTDYDQRLMDVHIAACRSSAIVGLFSRDQIDDTATREFAEATLFATSRASSVLDFFADRLKVQQREAGVRHDLIDAVFALGGEDDLVRLLARVKALQAFVGTEDGANLLAGYKRAANILKKERFEDDRAPAEAGALGREGSANSLALRPAPEHRTPGYMPGAAEVGLVVALDAAEAQAIAAVAAEEFERAMAALATLRAPIDAFFEQVTVNDPEPTIRARRLALLARVRDAVHSVADFSKIEG